MLIKLHNPHRLILIALVYVPLPRHLGQQRRSLSKKDDRVCFGQEEGADDGEDAREDGKEGGDPAPAACFAEKSTAL
jgi:hypothetical protein